MVEKPNTSPAKLLTADEALALEDDRKSSTS